MNKKAGFTYIELILVGIILTTLFVTVAVNIPSFIQKRELNAATQELTDAFAYTQRLSITAESSQTHGVQINPNNPFSHYEILTISNDGSVDSTDQYTFSDSITITQPATIQLMFFEKITGAPLLNLTQLVSEFTVKLETSKFYTTVTINPAGTIKNTPPTKK